MSITPEEKAELVAEIKAELERERQTEKENRVVFARVFKEYEAQFQKLSGESFYPCKQRDAISALVRGCLKVKHTARISAIHEPALRRFVAGVVELMCELEEACRK